MSTEQQVICDFCGKRKEPNESGWLSIRIKPRTSNIVIYSDNTPLWVFNRVDFCSSAHLSAWMFERITE